MIYVGGTIRAVIAQHRVAYHQNEHRFQGGVEQDILTAGADIRVNLRRPFHNLQVILPKRVSNIN